MRLVRLERQPSRVADDIRAALASLGRGGTVVGGVALVGVGSVTDRPIEAVVVLPHGVIVVIGVDLPDPALRLEAPLGAAWKADGWPLVADEEAVNPATEALDLSQACERRIAELVPGTAPVGTIVAVGPYVETVDQPPADLSGPVRVLHPTPKAMLAATVSLATARHPRSLDQARALIRGLAPDAPEFPDEVLLAEGFRRYSDDAPPPSAPTRPPLRVPAQSDWRTTTPSRAAVATIPAPAEPAVPAESAAPAVPAAVVAGAPPQAPAETEAPAESVPAPVEAGVPTASAESERTEVLAPPRFPGADSVPAPVASAPTGTTAAPPRLPVASAATGTPAAPPQAPSGEASSGPAVFPVPGAASRAVVAPVKGSRTVRWLPVGAIALLVALVVAAIVFATSDGDAPSGGGSTAASSVGHAPPVATTRSTAAAPVPSLDFAVRAGAGDQRCASHAFGDAQASLQQTSCSGVRRASYAATVDGRAGAVTIGIVAFPDAAQAAAFKAVADTPGGGGILDLATETGQWGASVPKFENAAYVSRLDGKSVRLVQAVWVTGPSTPDDPGLARAAKAALDLPVP